MTLIIKKEIVIKKVKESEKDKMNKYIVQIWDENRWKDWWRTDTLKFARKYQRQCIKMNRTTRVVKEM